MRKRAHKDHVVCLVKFKTNRRRPHQLYAGKFFDQKIRNPTEATGRIAADGSVECTLLDDNTSLEPKVVLALSRLAKSIKTGRSIGVPCKHIVEYLKVNYCNLDGDIESQVMTALLSCVKSGIVCALDNGRYLPTGPGSKGMISACFTRSSHGPKCSCLTTLKRMSRTLQKDCCVFKSSGGAAKRGRRASAKSKPPSRQSKRKSVCKTRPRKCAQRAYKVLEDRDKFAIRFAEDVEVDSICNYCLEAHSVRGTKSQKLCETCHPLGVGYVAPFDTFSPREENT